MSEALRAGYKLTEVGVIPEDWSSIQFGSLASIERGKFSARPRNDPRLYGGDIPFIQTGDVTRSNGSITTFTQTLNGDGLKVSRLFSKGTLFFTIAANIGDVGIAQFEAACPDSLVAISPNPSIDKCWLLYELSRRKTDFENLASPGVQLNINLEKLRPYLLPVPTLPEQRAIAAALSDIDTLLAKLDELIAKKRNIKQATMQQLLTGQTRLPGFSGEWTSLKLLTVCWFQEGPGVRTHQFKKSGVKLLNGTNIAKGKVLLETTNRYISQDEADGAYKHFLVDEGDILLATSGITIDRLDEKVAVANMENLPLCMNTSTVRFKVINVNLTANFLYVFLRSNEFKKQIGQQATGSAQINFGPSHLEKIEISLPPTLQEQSLIAKILTDLDAELEALETRRDKTQALKQGMMQELLTGRIRLV